MRLLAELKRARQQLRVHREMAVAFQFPKNAPECFVEVVGCSAHDVKLLKFFIAHLMR